MPDAFDPQILIIGIGSIVTTVVGFFIMWNIIRLSRRDQREDMQKQLDSVKGELKEHMNSKIDLMDSKLDNVKDEIKKNDESYRREFSGFSKWIDRIERNVESNIRRVTGTKRFYKSAIPKEEEE